MLQRSLRFVLPLSRRQLPSSSRASIFATDISTRIRYQGALIHTSSRLYAAVEEAKAEEESPSNIPPTTEASNQVPAEEDPLQKKLESQAREIIDLKVPMFLAFLLSVPFPEAYRFSPYRIST